MKPDAEAEKLQGVALSTRLPGKGSWLLGFVLLVSVSGGVTFAASPMTDWALEVLPNGTVLVRGSFPDEPRARTTEVPEWCYEFGLPQSLPLRQWQPDGLSSVLMTEWEHQGIRYIQSVLLTRCGRSDDPVPVLLVQITGESLANEYTDASAAFAVRRSGEPVELEYRQGWVYTSGQGNHPPLAAVEVEAGALAASTGRVLRFRAHMPPGTSGSMTLKIPFRPVVGVSQLHDLQDLHFDDEVRRVRKSGAAAGLAGWSASARDSWVFPAAREAESHPSDSDRTRAPHPDPH